MPVAFRYAAGAGPQGLKNRSPGAIRAANKEKRNMTIYGVALLAICTLLGALLGDVLGVGLGVKTNVGGVGIAMMLLMAARVWLMRKGALTHGLKLGIEFWAALYIPIVVAMAATQNVVAAVSGGPVVLIAGAGASRSAWRRQPCSSATVGRVTHVTTARKR